MENHSDFAQIHSLFYEHICFKTRDGLLPPLILVKEYFFKFRDKGEARTVFSWY